MQFTIIKNCTVQIHQKIPITQHFFHSSYDNYTKLINACIQNRALQSGRALHAQLVINGLVHSTHFASKLIAFYTRFKQLGPALKLFDKIPKSNKRGWVALIGSYARHGFYEETMSMFFKMQMEGLRYDKIVLPSVLKACGHLSDWNTGEKLHAVVLRNEFESDAFVMSALIDMYSKCTMVEKAKRVFDCMVEIDLVALNAMVSGYVLNGVITEALGLVEEMKILGMKPDVVTWNTLIAGFSRAKDKLAVEKIFRIMDDEGVKLDVVSWTSVITGSVQNFEHKEAFLTFRQMLSVGLCPTSETISGILPAAANIADLRRVLKLNQVRIVPWTCTSTETFHMASILYRTTESSISMVSVVRSVPMVACKDVTLL
ncbi:unnamed protein product [Fraxinus pennsylvanica]|uniref:Pentatricopeptide repeat-containing protein n=1 Tax=Fraxinus pennsylvanica TaxID=56036 RepID=A0AAD1ZVB1_9LAMI|nr:unnamed protein product [Fraxinus pennsylvanica]